MKKLFGKSSFALIVIALFAVIIYSNIYQSPFVFDDRPVIQEDLDIRSVKNYLSVDRLLKPRDIVYLTFALNHRFGKLNVFGYHLVNVLIHVINGFLVYFLAQMIFRQLYPPNVREDDSSARQGLQIQAERRKAKGERRKGKSIRQKFTIFNFQFSIPMMSLVAALIFVAHPIQTQAVTYTVQRCASMATMFYLAAVFFYLKARIVQQKTEVRDQRSEVRGQGARDRNQRSEVRGQGARDRNQRSEVRGQRGGDSGQWSVWLSAFYSLCILCGALAFLSKQNTASLPGVILLVEYLLIDRTWEGWKRKIPWFVAVFTLWAVFVLYISGFFSGGIEGRGLLEDVSALMQETEYVSRWSYLCTQFNVLVIYIRLLFLPIGQNLDYVYRFNNTFFDGHTPLAFALLVGVIAIGIWNIRKRPVISFGIFWFFITLSVESSIIPIRDAMFEHRLYLPMYGFALTLSYMAFYLLSKRRLLAILICVAIVGTLSVATYFRNTVWQNKITLWSDALAKNPQNFRAHNNLAVPLMEKGEYDRAIWHYNKAVGINPEWALAQYNLGVLKESLGKYEEAIAHYAKAVNLKPDYAEAHSNLGTVLLHQGNLDSAADHYLAAIKSKPDYATAHSNLAIVLTRKGRLDEAISHFREALRLTPDDERIRYNLNQVIKQKEKFADVPE